MWRHLSGSAWLSTFLMTWVWPLKSTCWKESGDPSLQVFLWLLYSAMVRTVPIPSYPAPTTRISKYNFKDLRRFVLIWLVTKPLQNGLPFIFLLEGNSSWLDITESPQGTQGWIILSHTKETNRNMWSSESFRKQLSPQSWHLLNTKFPFLASFGTGSHFVVQTDLEYATLSPLSVNMQPSRLWVPGFFSLSSPLLSSIISTPRLLFALIIILVGNRWQNLIKGLFPKTSFLLTIWDKGFSCHLYRCFGDFSQCHWARKRNNDHLDWKNRNKNIYVLGQ